MSITDFNSMAVALEASGEYRVLRRLKPRRLINQPDGSPTRLGIFLDVETTGLDPTRDEIIELAMVPFTYGPDDRIFEIRDPFQGLRQPSISIPPEITKLTGVDDAMVAGKSIDPAKVAAFIAPAAVVIAHNANFDRQFVERFSDAFSTKAWGCSLTQVPWLEEGFEGTKLSYLVNDCGFFYDAHRAVDDCHAALELLARPLPKSGMTGLAKLLEMARKPTMRIWAENSPFDFKDILKARGYRWNDGSDGRPRAWSVEVAEEKLAEELAFLKGEIYQREADIPVTKVTAVDRFSNRC